MPFISLFTIKKLLFYIIITNLPIQAAFILLIIYAYQSTSKLQMEPDLNCPLCEDQYKDDNLPRLLVGCGHTFCENCLKKIITQKKGSYKIICPEDGEIVSLKDNNLNNVPKNIALLKIIESKKNNSSFKDPQLQMSKIVKKEEEGAQDEQDAQDVQQAQDLVDAIVLSNSIGSEEKITTQKQQSTKIQVDTQKSERIITQKAQVKKQKQQKEQSTHKIEKTKKPQKKLQTQKAQIIQAALEKTQKVEKQEKKQLCKVHQKPLQVVCIMDLKKICVNCAIFGEHKGHDFKSLQEIENQRMGYYTALLQIMDKKQTIIHRISNQQTCQSIMEILVNKKNKMKNSISDKYKKLLQTIQSKQKQSLKSLDTLMQKTQTKLKSLMKIDTQIMEKYDNWQQKSYEQIKILEGSDFQAKLHLLFSETTSETDVLQIGDKIVDQMMKQQDNLLNQVQTTLQNIGVEFNLQIFNYVDGFVEVFDEAKRKKSKVRTKTEASCPSHINNVHNSAKSNSQKKQDKLSHIPQEFIKKQLPLPKDQVQLHHHKKQHHEEDLLELEYESSIKKPQFIKKQYIVNIPNAQIPIPQSPKKKQIEPITISSSNKFDNVNVNLDSQKSHRSTMGQKSNKKDESFTQDKIERPNKKKLAKIKVPQKYEKIVDGIANDQLETIDLTGAELGDATIVILSEFINGSKARTVKLIRNKLTDDGIMKILPYLKGVITLNISQNALTQRVLDILIDGRNHLQSMKSIILSQNKITERKAKPKIDKLKSLDLTISL